MTIPQEIPGRHAGAAETTVPFGGADAGQSARVAFARAARRRRRRRWIAVAVIVSIAAAMAVAYFTLRPASGPLDGVVTAPVRKGDVEDTITALGRLQPREYVDVGAQVSGQLKRLAVAVGQQVSEGDLLAEIDATLQEARVESGRAELRRLRAQLNEQIAQRDLARVQFAREQRLMQRNATSADAFETARTATLGADAKVAALQAQIEQQESEIKADEATLGYTRIYAPMPGTVVSISAQQGQTLNASRETPILMRVADLSAMTVRTQVSEADVGKLTPGMDVYFTTLGNPDRRWNGTLRQILPVPEVVNNVVLYTALFEVDNDGGLMAEMSAQVFFVRDAARDVVTVPVSALSPVRPEDGLYRVTVAREDGTTEEREVTIGVKNRIRAEVVSGLAPRERVVAGRSRTDGGERGGGRRRGFRL